MLVTGFPAQMYGTNCYIIAAGDGENCVIIDPGIGVIPDVTNTLAKHRLKPTDILLTHGHLDHTYSVTPLSVEYSIPVHIHTDDQHLLKDPTLGISKELVMMVEQHFSSQYTWDEPQDVNIFDSDDTLTLAGFTFGVHHAPGHTEGSVLLSVDGAPDGTTIGRGDDAPAPSQTIFSGDVLFAGSIGRTDLPGGSPAKMTESLKKTVWPLADDSLVLPGHGPATTIARERVVNPYLKEAVQ